MRVTFLTHYYPPEVGAPQARISTLARLLAERGISVTVHTGFPHYPDGRVRPPYRVRPCLVESQGPVRLIRSAVYPAPNRGFGRRLAGHLSFAGSALLTSRCAGAADVVANVFASALGRDCRRGLLHHGSLDVARLGHVLHDLCHRGGLAASADPRINAASR